MFNEDVNAIKLEYAKVAEMGSKLETFPLRSSMDVEPLLLNIESNKSPPTREDLAKFTDNLEQVAETHAFLTSERNGFTLFDEQIAGVLLPGHLVDQFKGAFDDEEELSADKFPTIKKLRTTIASLKSSVASKMTQLLSSQQMKEKIADGGYIIIEDRYCLMLKNTYKKGVGVVHGSSNTGRTLYVEPFEVVDMTNEIKNTHGLLRAEENRILFEMCQSIAEYREEVRAAVRAIAVVDVVHAKAKLGRRMKGVVPEVGTDGTIACVNARHPVLMLRGDTDAIGNTIELGKPQSVSVSGVSGTPAPTSVSASAASSTASSGSATTALVISGPNAGGKTIVLKTAGLFALMVKYAMPIPATDGARVDIFNVMADIGDIQTVSGDLSTFSGHLVVCREVLLGAEAHKRNTMNKGHSLVLLDEIGTGTDPAQGAALAQAVLEDLIAMGDVRVMVTTHYQRIKELAAGDVRFRIAAMEFVNNRPTYRLRLGSVGESFALEAADRMHLPHRVIARATSLLDDESRRVLALQKRLEEETELARQRQTTYEGKLDQLRGQEEGVETLRRALERERALIQSGKKEDFLEALKERERFAASIMSDIQRIADATDLSRGEKHKAITAKRAAVKAIRTEIESELVEEAIEDNQGFATPLPSGEPVEEGKTLVVLEKGILFNKRGIVTKRNKGRGRVHLRVAGGEIKIERHLVGYPSIGVGEGRGSLSLSSPFLSLSDAQDLLGESSDGVGRKLTSKEREMMRMQDELVDLEDRGRGSGRNRGGDISISSSSDSSQASATKTKNICAATRRAGNTVDLRGLSYSRQQERVTDVISRFFDDEYVYILCDGKGQGQGQGQGQEQEQGQGHRGKLLTWLRGNPLVRSVRQEGDYTLIEFLTD
jgi:DNA mismatch repair protein MutS2